MEKQVEKGGENTFYPIDRLKTDLLKENPSLLNDLENKNIKGEAKITMKHQLLMIIDLWIHRMIKTIMT